MKTIVETNTGKLLFSTDNDNYICLENESKIDIHLKEMFVSPFFDFQSNSYYEGATSEEIASMIVVPDSISQMNLKIQLLLRNIEIQDIVDTINSIPEVMFSTIDKQIAIIKFNEAVSYDRYNADLNLVATLMGLSQEDLDEIFINGNLL